MFQLTAQAEADLAFEAKRLDVRVNESGWRSRALRAILRESAALHGAPLVPAMRPKSAKGGA